MKKIISVLLCLVLLCSFSSVVSAVDTAEANEPTIRLTYSAFKEDDATSVGYLGGILIEILDCSDFSSCELIFDLDYYYLVSSVNKATAIGDGMSAVANCEVAFSEREVKENFVVTMQQASKTADVIFAQLVLQPLSAVCRFQPELKAATLYTGNGRIEDVNIEIINNAQPLPELYMRVGPAYSNLHMDDIFADPEQFVTFNFQIGACPDFESFEILITYNPDVLEYSANYPFLVTCDGKKSAVCTVLEPGKAKITGSDPYDISNSNFNAFCFKVIGEGETNIEATLVSWKDLNGEITNGNFDAKIHNFNAVDYSLIKPLIDIPDAVILQYPWYDWQITANMTVAEFAETVPNDIFEIYDTNGNKLTSDDIIGTGCTYKLNCYDQYYVTERFVVNKDLDGNGQVTAEDARLALRFAVGLEKATNEQCHAAGVSTTKNFTSDIARSILRCSIGLEP